MIHLDEYNVSRFTEITDGNISINSSQFLSLLATIECDNSILKLFKNVIGFKFKCSFIFRITDRKGEFTGFNISDIPENLINAILLDQELAEFFNYSVYRLNTNPMVNTLKNNKKNTSVNKSAGISISGKLKKYYE